PLVESRIKEATRLSQELAEELSSVEEELVKGRATNAGLRLRSLAERYPGAKNVSEALARAERVGRDANRGAVRERLPKAVEAATKHESVKRLRDAAQAWREAAALDPDRSEAQEGIDRVERMLAEFDALVGQSRNLLSAGDPEGAERTAV